MTQPRHNRRNKKLTMEIDAQLKALQAEGLQLRNARHAPQASGARLKAARQDALALHIDMETLERIERRLEQTRRDIISRQIRDRVMKPE